MALSKLLEQANIHEEVISLKLEFCLLKYHCHDVKKRSEVLLTKWLGDSIIARGLLLMKITKM